MNPEQNQNPFGNPFEEADTMIGDGSINPIDEPEEIKGHEIPDEDEDITGTTEINNTAF